MTLLSQSPKTDKAPAGYINRVCFMAPANEAGPDYPNACKGSTADCRKHCLFTSGRGQTPVVRDARIARSRLFWDAPEAWTEQLHTEMRGLLKFCKHENATPVVRLNGTTDLWISWIYRAYPAVQFVEYTKIVSRYKAWMARSGAFATLPNVHYTFSWSGRNKRACLAFLAAGGTVAVPMLRPFPKRYLGFPVLDGDTHDCRHLDKPAHWVALQPKGSLARDTASPMVAKQVEE